MQTITSQDTAQPEGVTEMELIITRYQEKADQALAQMQKAMQEYDITHDSDLLELSLEWELSAYRYLSLVEEALTFI